MKILQPSPLLSPWLKLNLNQPLGKVTWPKVRQRKSHFFSFLIPFMLVPDLGVSICYPARWNKKHSKCNSFVISFYSTVDTPFWPAMIFGRRDVTARWRDRIPEALLEKRHGTEPSFHALVTFLPLFNRFQRPNFENSFPSNHKFVLLQIFFVCFMVCQTWVSVSFGLKNGPRTSPKRPPKSAKTPPFSACPRGGRPGAPD